MQRTLFVAIVLIGISAISALGQTGRDAMPTSVPAVRDNANRAANDRDDPAALQIGYTRPDAKTRTKRYFDSMFGYTAIGKSVATAGISTWRNSPEEWGPHWEGFGRRFASSMGKGIIKNSVTFGMDEALKLDSHFYRSEKRDVGSRIKNALISPVTARKPSGKRVIGVPRIVGTYSSSIIAAEAWYPPRYDYKDGLRNGTISLGMTAFFNLFKEFVLKK